MAKRLTLVLFFLLLFAPLAQMAFNITPLTPLVENRTLNPPAVFKSWDSLGSYFKDSIAWFNDHYGFRSLLIRLKTQLDYSVFKISDRTYVGKNGWLFIRDLLEEKKPFINILLKDHEEEIVAGAGYLADQLAKRGIKLIISIMPMKDVIYPQYLPDWVIRLPNSKRIDSLENRLKTIPNLVYLDVTPLLREIAKTQEVYHHTDFHWNDVAAFKVARILVNQLATAEGHSSPLWSHPLEIERRPFIGIESHFMPLFNPLQEDGLWVKKNWEDPPENLNSDYKKLFQKIYEYPHPELPQPELLGTIVVQADSFFESFIRSGFAKYFKKTYHSHWGMTNVQDIMDNLPTDCKYVYLEAVESNYDLLNFLAKQKPPKP